MYKSAKRFSVLKRILEDGMLLSPKKVSGLETIRTYAGAMPSLQRDYNTNSFGEVLKFRRQQASRTIIVQINASKNCEELLEYLSIIGKVKTMYHYYTQKALHLALVEMEDERSYYNVLDHAQNVPNQVGAPYTNFFWFKPLKKNGAAKVEVKNNLITFDSPISINSKNKTFDFLNDIRSIRTTMFELHEISKISDIGFRLRFLSANQLETSLKCINPSITVLPFGSSITGFGTIHSDIDMVGLVNGQYKNRESDLFFQVKSFSSDRTMEQVHIQLLFEIIKLILPGCSEVFPIPNARVPIVRYRQDFTTLECDISLYRVESMIMSEVLFFACSLDYRVKFLVFLIRHWANVQGLINKKHPGKWISNFCLTLLVLHFLQQESFVNPPLVPPLYQLSQERTTLLSNEVYSAFFNKYSAIASSNKQPIEELLLYFFKYYSEFNFAQFGVNLRTGEKIEKSTPAMGALFVENPLEPDLNVGKNVTAKEVMRIRGFMQDSFAKLDKTMKLEEIDKVARVPFRGSEDHLFRPEDSIVRDKVRPNTLKIDFDRLVED